MKVCTTKYNLHVDPPFSFLFFSNQGYAAGLVPSGIKPNGIGSHLA